MTDSFTLVMTDGLRWLGEPIAVAGYDGAIAAGARFGLNGERMLFEDVYPDGSLVFRVSRETKGVWRTREAAAPQHPLRACVEVLARALGFPLFGVTGPELPARYHERFTEWLAAGGAADMDFMQRHAEKRRMPELVLSGAQSVLVLATPYPREAGGGVQAKVARYALGRDYHQVLPGRLAVLRRYLEKRGGRCYTSVDTGPVLERAYAEQAGVGWIGKNGNLISRRYGSYIFLGTVWTTLALARDAPHEDFCGVCVACLEGCPTQAITRPGWVESKRCISYLTIEQRGEPASDAPLVREWVYGCDVCQEVCPWNRFAQPVVIEKLAPLHLFPETPQAWLALSDEAAQETLAGTALRRAGPEGLRRNARALLKIIP